MSAADIAAAMKGYRTQRGWMAKCPAHEDGHASLSLADGADGKLLAFCFAGCSFAEIRSALVERGLLANNDNQPRRRPPPFRVSPGDQLMLANIVEDDRALSAAWSTGNVEFFVSRFLALKRGCDGADMAARCAIIDLGPDLTAFVKALFGGGRS